MHIQHILRRKKEFSIVLQHIVMCTQEHIMLFLFFNKTSYRFREIIFIWMVATPLPTLQN